MSTSQDVDVVMGLERKLQTASCRRDPERMRALLADDFEEVGASGRVWDRASTLELPPRPSYLVVAERPEGWRLVHHQGTLLPGP